MNPFFLSFTSLGGQADIERRKSADKPHPDGDLRPDLADPLAISCQAYESTKKTIHFILRSF